MIEEFDLLIQKRRFAFVTLLICVVFEQMSEQNDSFKEMFQERCKQFVPYLNLKGPRK